MEAMASRPFRPILLELYPRGTPSSTPPNEPSIPTPLVTSTTNATPAVNNCCVTGSNGAIQTSTNKTSIKSCNNGVNKIIVNNSTSPDSLSSNLLDTLGSLKVKKKVQWTVNHMLAGMKVWYKKCKWLTICFVTMGLISYQVNPSPIALEPCCGNRAAVLSLLVQLPTGGEPYTPVGHPGQSPPLNYFDVYF